MSTTINPDSDQQAPNKQYELPLPVLLLAGMVFLLIFGVMMAMFSVTYIQDMATLRNVPNLIWNFACGKPLESDITLPFLLTISIVSIIGSAVLYGWRRWLLKQMTQETVISE